MQRHVGVHLRWPARGRMTKPGAERRRGCRQASPHTHRRHRSPGCSHGVPARQATPCRLARLHPVRQRIPTRSVKRAKALRAQPKMASSTAAIGAGAQGRCRGRPTKVCQGSETDERPIEASPRAERRTLTATWVTNSAARGNRRGAGLLVVLPARGQRSTVGRRRPRTGASVSPSLPHSTGSASDRCM